MSAAEQPGDPIRAALLSVPAVAELAAHPQWVQWKREFRSGSDESTKVPYQVDGRSKASSTNPATWASFDAALAATKTLTAAHGIGFVFVDGGELAGVDLDGCRQLETGEIAAWAQEIVEALGSYTEVSPSGTGVKVFVHGVWPDDHGRKVILHDAPKDTYKMPAIEVYDRWRYFTVTGLHLAGTPQTIAANQAALDGLYARFFAADGSPRQDHAGDADGPAEPTPIDFDLPPSAGLDDDEVLRIARGARNGAKFSALFDDGDLDRYDGDDNRADCALVAMLIFYTADDLEQLDRLFRQSALNRPKWMRRADYRRLTIRRAVRGMTEFYARDDSERVRVTPPGGRQNGRDSQAGRPEWPSPGDLHAPAPPPTLPLDCFPEVIVTHARDIAARQQAAIDYPVWSLLITLITLIGRGPRMRARQDDDWFEVLALWAALLGDPGGMKTPAQTAGLRRLRGAQAIASEAYQANRTQWAADCAALKAAGDKVRLAARQAEQPVEQFWLTDDYTAEKLSDLLQPQVSRGLAIVRSELSGVIGALNKYRQGQGDDRQVLLECYDGGARTINRVTRGNIFVPQLQLNIIGGIQPERAQAIFGQGVEDGLAQRFIAVWPAELPWAYVTRARDIPAQGAFDTVAQRLQDAGWGQLLLTEDWVKFPFARYGPAGQAIYDAWEAQLMTELRGPGHRLTGPLALRLSKYRGLFQRLALAFRLIEWATAAAPDDQPWLVGEPLVERVRRLFDTYLRPMDERVYGTYGDSADAAHGRTIAAHIQRHHHSWPRVAGHAAFTARMIRRAHLADLNNQPTIEGALQWLAAMDWIREADLEDRRPGRPSARWLVNPGVPDRSGEP